MSSSDEDKQVSKEASGNDDLLRLTNWLLIENKTMVGTMAEDVAVECE